MTIRVQLATLCDAASVREGLLSVLGAGISLLQRTSFPAPLGVTIAALFELDEAPISNPTIRFTVRSGSGDEVGITDYIGELDQALLFTNFPATLPVILNANDLLLPQAGDYQLKIYIDDAEIATIRFRALVHAPEDLDDIDTEQQEVYSA